MIHDDTQNIDLLFVNPSLDWKLDKEKQITLRIEENIPNQETPHIGIAYLLAVAKKENLRVKYIDMVTEGFSLEQLIDFIGKTTPAMIGFTAFTIQIYSAGYIAEKIKGKFPNIKICVGGPHAIALPKLVLDEFPAFDFAISGECEELLPKIFDTLGNRKGLEKLRGVVTKNKDDISCDQINNLDDLPFPAWDMFDLTKYPGTYPHRRKLELPMVTGRGCPYRCNFCCRALGGDIRRRSVGSVIAEIERNINEFKCESIAFLDETFVINKKWTEEFLNTLISRGLNKKISWSCSSRVSNVSQELLRQMNRAGCYYIFFGLESADDDTLKQIKKNITIEQMKNAVKWAKQAGIIPVGAFIIGLPGDTEDKIIKAIRLAEELNLYSVTFPIAIPFPGTELREMALRNEYGMRIISDNWNHYGKQDPGVMESKDLPWAKRKELQQIAYMRNPKKKIESYIQKISNYGQMARNEE
ncbi:MAG: B12-binding domain-containing radical SAM protein [Nitrospirae bacterium]|nr:B12-binding domain-containing radical SAM protein [Nitrospirota bacterium]